MAELCTAKFKSSMYVLSGKPFLYGYSTAADNPTKLNIHVSSLKPSACFVLSNFMMMGLYRRRLPAPNRYPKVFAIASPPDSAITLLTVAFAMTGTAFAALERAKTRPDE